MRREYTPEFERAWSLYPSRGDSDNPKWPAFKAWRARLREGATQETLMLATERYAAHCRRKGSWGTEFVRQAATFYGPNEIWQSYLPQVSVPEKPPVPRVVEQAEPLIDARPFIRELLAGLAERKRSPLNNFVRAK